MKSLPLISIIITCKNASKWIDRCLTSLDNQTYNNFEIIFVDDASTDESVNIIKNLKLVTKNLILVKNKKNVGFAQANNIGAKKATGEYLFILNADTYLEKNSLEKLARILKTHSDYQLMQLDIRKYDRSNMKDDPCIFTMDRFGYPFWLGKKNKEPFYADAAAMVIKRSLFLKLKGFDEKFYIYLEDLDLSWRARLMGERVYFLKGVYVYHFAGGTSTSTHSQKNEYRTTLRRRFDAQKNNLRSLIKNYSLINLLWALPVSIFMASIEGWLYLLKGNLRGFMALHRAIWWNFTNLPDSLIKRRTIQQMRMISDKQILRICTKSVSKFNSFFTHGIPKTD